jgi:SP family myo-inositol transporter-like MFS transporter 13
MEAMDSLKLKPESRRNYNLFLLLVAGLGGLLYGVDVGIIAGALPYLEATSYLNPQQLSIIVAAVLIGSVLSTLLAGLLADRFGRKKLMTFSGLLFVASIPIIALAQGYGPLVAGRLLQGMSAGLIGVVVPLYLAECLSASARGKGTGIFQWLLTLGIVAAAVIGLYFSFRVEQVSQLNDPAKLFAFQDKAWRGIFWVSLPPGILFVLGSLGVAESPRWLARKGAWPLARAALLRSRTVEEADVEMAEMEATIKMDQSKSRDQNGARGDSLLHRKYVIPFLLACVILACNQFTGINSIIGYNTNILLQGGLTDLEAHRGYLILTIVNFLVTIAAVALVDRKGRKFLLSLGSAGIIASLLCVGILFRNTERQGVDCKEAIQAMVTTNQTVNFLYTSQLAQRFLSPTAKNSLSLDHPTTLTITYAYGDFCGATPVARADGAAGAPVQITRDNCVPANQTVAFFSNPFADLSAAKTAPLIIQNARILPVPSKENGWMVAGCLFAFMAFFAIGPGVCVWLALSELMPTRIRSNGMSIALLLNQVVSAGIAVVFLPTAGKYGYSTMFFAFAACTMVYFITAAFFLPETKGKTLEEIEAYFEKKDSDAARG